MNLTRASTVLPVFLVVALVTTHGRLLAGIDGTRAAWLALSVLCAYGFADNVFFASARRLGITTALAKASSYPLWAALAGALWRGERFGLPRAAGTALCVGGIISLILLAPRAVEEHAHAHSTKRDAREGILLALLTSVLWAGTAWRTPISPSARRCRRWRRSCRCRSRSSIAKSAGACRASPR